MPSSLKLCCSDDPAHLEDEANKKRQMGWQNASGSKGALGASLVMWVQVPEHSKAERNTDFVEFFL